MALRQFKLPDLGEGLTEGEILGWLVAEGDTITLNQPIVEVETAKAAVEVPSPYAGLVVSLHHAAGETVDVGNVIITVDTEPGAIRVSPEPVALPPLPNAAPDDLVPDLPDALGEEPAAGLIGGAAPGGRTAVLVGYGPKTVTAKRRPRKGASDFAATVAPLPPVRVSGAGVAARAELVATAEETNGTAVLAKPPVRKLARDLGVDLRAVSATGPQGTVTRADVQAAAANGTVEASPSTAAAPVGLLSGASRRAQRIPIRGVRKLIAENMVASAFTAPHVTEFLTVDVTAMTELVARLRTLPDFAEVKVTPLTIVAKALLVACRRHPEVNASWDEAAGEIVVHGGVHLGIAAATPRGLLVPNIKDADLLGLADLAAAITGLTTTARAGNTQPADMSGGTITITNVGVFGVDTGTPILNPGEAAILCFGAVREMPWVVDGAIAVRQVTTLALSFDHRLIDGALGSQFLADVGGMLADPARLIAWS